MNQFQRLFAPRSIAVIGASDDPKRAGGECVNALLKHGYKGGIYPVNPRLQNVYGLDFFPSVKHIKAEIDLAVIALPAKAVPDVVTECGERGISNVIVLGAGFREVGPEGAALQDAMVANARKLGVRIVGPNCLGLANIHERVFAAFGSISRPPLLNPGPVSMVMQSGGFGSSLAFACHAAGIGFRILVSSGNEADLNAPQLMDALVDDDKTEIILGYIEGVDDGRALMAVAQRAMEKGKTLLLWKAGKTRQGVKSAATHTANMTGTYDIWKAALRQCGVIEVRSIDEAADYIKVLLAKKYPRGRNVAVVTASGGSAVVYADAADEYGLQLETPSAQTLTILRESFPLPASIQNPIDLAGTGVNDKTKPKYVRGLKALLDDPAIHQLCPMFSAMTGTPMKIGAEALAELEPQTDKPMIVFSSVPYEVGSEAFDIMKAAGIPVLFSPSGVVRAQAMLADYAAARARLKGAAPIPQATHSVSTHGHASGSGTLDEMQSKQIVHAFVPVTQDVIVSADDESALRNLAVRFPVAVKIVSPDIAHKSDVGGVVLNVKDGDELLNAWKTVIANARKHRPSARITGVLVAQMITDGIETLLGITNDDVFGPVIAFGMGGVLAEVQRDIAYRIAPFGADEARSMIDQLRSRPIFDGIRGKPAADVDALVDALVKASEFAWAQRDSVAEVDVNPLLVRPKGLGVIAADAVVVRRGE